MKPTCTPYEEWIDLDTAGWLEDSERTKLHAHLEHCHSCRDKASMNQKLTRALASLPATPPPLVLHPAPQKRVVGLWAWISFAAAAAIIILLTFPQTTPPETPYALAINLRDAPPTLATYREVLLLSDDEMEEVFDAHARRFSVYQPPNQLTALSITSQGLLL